MEVTISILASSDSKWFGIGFPDPSYYYEKTLRKSGLLNGYALIYTNGDIEEYDIVSTDNIITAMSLQSSQDYLYKNITSSGGTVSITLTREIDTGDPNDFVFDVAGYLDCYPFLMTVAMGDGPTFDGTTNDYGSSYIYLYDSSLMDDSFVHFICHQKHCNIRIVYIVFIRTILCFLPESPLCCKQLDVVQ